MCLKVHFLRIFVLVFLIGPAEFLECYTCNVSTSTADEDGCHGIGSMAKCASNSVCLASTYEIKSGIVKTYTTMQSCFLDMDGRECETFFKTQKVLHKTSAVALKTCYTCRSDKCNENRFNPNRSSYIKTPITLFIVGALILSLI